MRPFKTEHFTSISKYFKQLLSSSDTVTDVFLANENMVRVQSRAIKECEKPYLHSNFAIGCLTTSYARCLLYREMAKVSDYLVYVDTDSLMLFYSGNVDELGLNVGLNMGLLKNELPLGDHVTKFCCLGSKFYGFETKSGKVINGGAHWISG